MTTVVQQPIMASPSDWHFVVSDGPKVPKDPSLRTMIRKQAMKDVAIARKQRNKRNRKDTAQSDSSECDTSTGAPEQATVLHRKESTPSSSDSERWSADIVAGVTGDQERSEEPVLDLDAFEELLPFHEPWFSESVRDWTVASRPSLLQLPYDALKAKYSVDITELGILTSFNIGSDTIAELASSPSRVISLLGSRHTVSFLDYIPARYGHNRALTAAVDCVAAALQRRLMGRAAKDDPMAMRQYATALQELQTAVSSDTACSDPDVLCAVQLMGLHEVIEGSRTSAWRNHVNGAAQIVRHRTPSRFTDDFERALFLGHIGPIVMDAMLLGTKCYLDSPEWLALWKSMIDRTPGPLNDRSELAINLRAHMCRLPTVLASIVEVVTGPRIFDKVAMKQLRKQVQAYVQELMDWSDEYKAYCVRSSLSQPTHDEIALRRELFGASLEMLAFEKRLLAAVCEEQRHEIEVEVQAIARLIFDVQKEPGPKHAFLFSRHERDIAQLVTITHDEWVEDTTKMSREESLLAVRKRVVHMMWFMSQGWNEYEAAGSEQTSNN